MENLVQFDQYDELLEQGRTQDFFARGANEPLLYLNMRAPIYLNMRQLLSCPICLK